MTIHQPMGYPQKLSDKEILKELLFALRVRGNIEEISESAIREFGSITAVLRQTPSELKRIRGISPTTIKHIKTIYSLLREIIKPESYPTKSILNFEDLAYFMLAAPRFDGDALRLLFLDEDQMILKDFIYKKGFGNQVKIYFREIVKEILKVGVSSIVFIHHKISCSPEPSARDREIFMEFNEGFKKLDIKLVDYLIISDNALFSFRNNTLLPSKGLTAI